MRSMIGTVALVVAGTVALGAQVSTGETHRIQDAAAVLSDESMGHKPEHDNMGGCVICRNARAELEDARGDLLALLRAQD